MMLTEWPRFLGFPRQLLVHSLEEAQSLVEQNNGTAPCYANCNWFPVVENNIPKTIMYEWLPFDLDSPSIDEPLEDARRLVAFAMKNNIPCVTRFSGSHGFHVYYRFVPKHLQMNPGASRLVAALQNWCIDQAGVKTADIHIIGDLRRLLRIPQTAWAKEVNSVVKVNGLFCITLTTHEVMTLTATEILKIASEPRPTPVAAMTAPPTQNILEFAKAHAIDIDTFARKHASTAPQSFMPYSQVSDKILEELLQRPCVVSALCSTHPAHIAKFHMVSRLNNLGFSISWIEGLVADLAARYSWDVYDYATTHEQVEGIVRGGYKDPKCSAIQAKGGCMGSACSRFKVCA